MNNKLIELAEKEIIRKNILEVLEECGDEGASEELISKCVSRAGIKCDTESGARRKRRNMVLELKCR